MRYAGQPHNFSITAPPGAALSGNTVTEGGATGVVGTRAALSQAWGRVVGQDKVAMGFMTVDTPSDTGEQSPDNVCRIWRLLHAEARDAPGVSTWSINLDKSSGYDFARGCALSVARD